MLLWLPSAGVGSPRQAVQGRNACGESGTERGRGRPPKPNALVEKSNDDANDDDADDGNDGGNDVQSTTNDKDADNFGSM